jgi:steroid delta-isomerase
VSEAVKNALTAYAHAWAHDDRERFLGLFAPDAFIEDPVGSPRVEGLEAIAGFWDRVHSLGMTYETEVIRVVSCGREGVLVFNVTTRAPGVTMTVQLVDVFQVDDEGKIVSMRAFWDQDCMAMD